MRQSTTAERREIVTKENKKDYTEDILEKLNHT
jgi:hypothetical protein